MAKARWQQVKKNLKKGLTETRKQIGHLSTEVRRDPKGGLRQWLNSKDEYDARIVALEQLRADTKRDSFTFERVADLFSQFSFPEEDREIATWYARAHDKLVALEARIQTKNCVDERWLRPLCTELKYICDTEDFHQRWKLLELQQEVGKMYQYFLDYLDELKADREKQREFDRKKLVVEEKQIELARIREQKEAIALQREKAQLQKEKVTAERALHETKRQEHIEAQKRLSLESEHQAKVSEAKRREELQSSYNDLAQQWDNQLKDSE